MSRIRNCLTVAAGAAAGLFLSALASSATAGADAVPINPGLPGVVEQVVASSTTIPQQLLQTTTSALSGTSMAPAAPAQSPLATATFNVPPTSSAMTPTTQATGLPGLSGFPANLTSVLPFPMPNFGPPTPAPTAAVPSVFAPSAPVAPMEVMLIPGLP
ncbi:hypothetical protein MTER_21160 [Mycolicibacter terrae]|jgi:hypothetical protein|uniref:Uncharacterized protein n=1 Tax=Mycolicibacter terrae TaxID=1788 RepID=A0AAD1MHW5_9MYCO|nr:hypothetical protein [Mycolicibacter terrae]ORW97543.1 hypothetical protein AWC28_09225 [Mycolicibacter terrae]BBX22705.1 hypothetical protein MTER_21160 [Mycolicibacter terrae]SNV72584.1 Uncharacterised protein [Mycolicibacter terrae]